MDSDYKRMIRINQSFFNSSAKRSAVHIFFAKIVFPCISMRIKMDKCNLPELLCKCTQMSECNGMVSSHHNWDNLLIEYWFKCTYDMIIGSVNISWYNIHITIIHT